MKRKIKRLIQVLAVSLAISVATFSISASAFDESPIKVTHYPITEEFITEVNQKLDNSELSSQKEVKFDSSEITVTHYPITEEFMSKMNEQLSLSTANNISPRDANVPQSFRNLATGAYTGGGTYTNSFMYSLYYFSCNKDKQLKIEGAVYLPIGSNYYKKMTMWLVNYNDGTSTEITIQPTQATTHTAYYFNFAIGPLNPNDFYYLKFSPIISNVQHTLNYTISH